MSDNSISVVPRLSNYPDHEKKAAEILQWLIAADIVKPTLSDCILSTEHGYAVSSGAVDVVKHPEHVHFDLLTNGLEIVTKREVFHTAENGMDQVICPHCGENIAGENWSFLNEWAAEISNNIICPLCNTASDIHQYTFDPVWGFSNLGFTFWNSPEFTDAFIASFEEKLNVKVDVVYAHI